jgi:hypothetical protein
MNIPPTIIRFRNGRRLFNNGPRTYLAGGVPYLKFDAFPVDCEQLGHERGPDGRLGKLTEVVGDEPQDQ